MIVCGILRIRKEPIGNLWITIAGYARPIFGATMARDLFFQVLCVIHFDEKNTRNEQRSPDE
jgi:hypothetical protein